MSYPDTLIIPHSIKTNRHEVYALGKAVANWKQQTMRTFSNNILKGSVSIKETSFYRLYILDELSRKVIAKKLVDHAHHNKEFRIRLTSTQMVLCWICYTQYLPPGGPVNYEEFPALRSIMSKIDQEVKNRFNRCFEDILKAEIW